MLNSSFEAINKFQKRSGSSEFDASGISKSARAYIVFIINTYFLITNIINMIIKLSVERLKEETKYTGSKVEFNRIDI